MTAAHPSASKVHEKTREVSRGGVGWVGWVGVMGVGVGVTWGWGVGGC